MLKRYKVTLNNEEYIQESVIADGYTIDQLGSLCFYLDDSVDEWTNKGIIAPGLWLSCFLEGEAKADD